MENSSEDIEDSGILGEAAKEKGDSEGDTNESEKTEEKSEEPEEYEISFSEESPLSEEQQEGIVKKIESYGLSKKQAEELIAEIESTHKRAADSVVSQISEKIKADREALLSDPAFKTEEARSESFSKIGEVVRKFGDEDFSKFLNSSSGNSLPLAKFLLRIADAAQSDDPTTGRGAGDNAQEKETLAKKWYPHFFDKN